ncbi:MAG: DUF4249 domain-containing protein [Bacteroidales bacterium]|nr:DUF4249 domain-containing protein [Bacteroidales bacterium]
MKKIKIATLLSLLALTACEDVIEIDLDSIEPKLVIEAVITDQTVEQTVKLTKTGDYFEPGIYPAVSYANVIISDNLGNSETLSEVNPGIYQTTNLQGITGIVYELSVEVENMEYTAISEMPEKINIDTLSTEFFEATPRFDEGYMVKCHFTDPAGISNYYRFKVYENGVLLNSSSDFILSDDKIFNGNETQMPLRMKTFQINDTVTVELLSLNKDTYDYYNTLIESSSGPGFISGSSTPVNPVSNISNGAMGYFGVYTINSKTIIIE